MELSSTVNEIIDYLFYKFYDEMFLPKKNVILHLIQKKQKQ